MSVAGSKAPFRPSRDHFRSAPLSRHFQRPSACLKGAITEIKQASKRTIARAPPLRLCRAKRNTASLVGPPPIACRCLRQQATLVARVPDCPAGSFTFDEKFTTARTKKPGATNARRALPWSITETVAPLALYFHSGEVTTIVQGSLATHNSDCVAKWRAWLGNRANIS
jgi:hypothetical protein